MPLDFSNDGRGSGSYLDSLYIAFNKRSGSHSENAEVIMDLAGDRVKVILPVQSESYKEYDCLVIVPSERSDSLRKLFEEDDRIRRVLIP